MTKTPDDITAEVSLLGIWWNSRKTREPVGNHVVRLAGLILVIAYAVASWSSAQSLIDSAKAMASVGLPTILGLLGFLLAGYTVFISIARRDLLVAMSAMTDSRSGLSWLKVSMYTYVGALAELLIVAAAMLAVMILGQSGGLLATLVAKDETGMARKVVACVGFVLMGYAFIHTIVALKVTIRNVHHGIAAAIRWDRENPQSQGDASG